MFFFIKTVPYIEDPYKAVSQCHAIAILTEWDLYRNIDYEKVFSKMKKPAFVFDGRNILNHKKLFDMGSELTKPTLR